MLEKCGKWMNYVGPLKKFKRNIDMWKQIAVDLEWKRTGVIITYPKIENRYKTVSKRKNKSLVINKNSVAAHEVPYDEKWKQITNENDSIVPGWYVFEINLYII